MLYHLPMSISYPLYVIFTLCFRDPSPRGAVAGEAGGVGAPQVQLRRLQAAGGEAAEGHAGRRANAAAQRAPPQQRPPQRLHARRHRQRQARHQHVSGHHILSDKMNCKVRLSKKFFLEFPFLALAAQHRAEWQAYKEELLETVHKTYYTVQFVT